MKLNEMERRIELLEKENSLLREKRDLLLSDTKPEVKPKAKADKRLTNYFARLDKIKSAHLDVLKIIHHIVDEEQLSREEVVLSLAEGMEIECNNANDLFSRMKRFLYNQGSLDGLDLQICFPTRKSKAKSN